MKLRGLPWSATDEEVARFFSPLQPISVNLTLNHHGRYAKFVPTFGLLMCFRPTGEGYVEFGNENDAMGALEYHKRSIGSRYIEVFKVPRNEMDRAVNPPLSGGGGGGGGGGGNGGGVCYPWFAIPQTNRFIGCCKDARTPI